MLWSPRRTALLLAAAVLAGIAAAPAPAAQTGPSATWTAPRPTASTAPTPDATETAAAPRRRPIPRSLARQAQAARTSTPDTLMTTVSSRVEASSAAARSAMIERSLRDDGPNWIGIPYRWGGTTRRGIDCSAFVQQFVRENLGIELPRTTAGQRYEGISIDRSDLLPGDLVFFRRSGVRHVGVYLSGGEFIHASSSRGVTVSTMDSGYWNRHYWMSRRIVTEPSGRRPTPRSLVPRDSIGVRG